MSARKLFEGELMGSFGGLSNEHELVNVCPEEFRNSNNPWCEFLMKFFYGGGSDKTNWKFRCCDECMTKEKCTFLKCEAKKQYKHFEWLLRSSFLDIKLKFSVGAWMLSRILKEVPEYIPPNRQLFEIFKKNDIIC